MRPVRAPQNTAAVPAAIPPTPRDASGRSRGANPEECYPLAEAGFAIAEEIAAKAYWVVCYRSIANPAARAEYTKLAVPTVLACGPSPGQNCRTRRRRCANRSRPHRSWRGRRLRGSVRRMDMELRSRRGRVACIRTGSLVHACKRRTRSVSSLILLSQTESPRRTFVARDSAHGRDSRQDQELPCKMKGAVARGALQPISRT